MIGYLGHGSIKGHKHLTKIGVAIEKREIKRMLDTNKYPIELKIEENNRIIRYCT